MKKEVTFHYTNGIAVIFTVIVINEILIKIREWEAADVVIIVVNYPCATESDPSAHSIQENRVDAVLKELPS